MKWNLSEQKQNIGSCCIFKLSFSAIKSVQHNLITFLSTISKISYSKGLKITIGTGWARVWIVADRWSGINVGKRSIRSTIAPSTRHQPLEKRKEEGKSVFSLLFTKLLNANMIVARVPLKVIGTQGKQQHLLHYT